LPRFLLRGTLACAGLALLSAGCGGDDGPRALVVGKVLLDDSPLEEGEVTFIPSSGGLGTSQIGPDGRYSLIGQDKQAGVAPGSYVAIVMPSMAQIKKSQGDPMANVKASSIPATYNNAATSPLKYDVKDGPNEIDLLLETKPKK
jgi:hypothetical protein